MKLSPVQIKTLQFVLRDVASKAELDHRFTDGHAADELVKLGLLNTHAGFYSITAAGREVAVAQRKEAAVQQQVKPVPAYVAKAPETISIKQTLNIVELSQPQSGVFKLVGLGQPQKGENTMNAVTEKRSTNAVQIKYNPKDLVDVVVLRNQINKIDLYDEISVDNQHLRKRMSRDLYNFKRANILTEDFDGLVRVGTKCNAYLAKQAGKKDTSGVIKFPKPSADFKLVDTAELQHKAKTGNAPAIEAVEKSPDDQFDIPAFLRKDPVVKAAEAPVPQNDQPSEELIFVAPTPAEDTFEEARKETKADIEKCIASMVPASKASFAYTNEKTLIIFGQQSLLELNPADTAKLMEFCEAISMVDWVAPVPEIEKHKAVLEICQSLMQYDPKELHAQIQVKALEAATKVHGLEVDSQ